MTPFLRLAAPGVLLTILLGCEVTGGDRDGEGDTTGACGEFESSPCPENSHCENTPRSEMGDYTCACDEGYIGEGYNACYLASDETGSCVYVNGAFVCTCNPGFAQLTEYDIGCSDIDECALEDQGGCAAYCFNTFGGAECLSSVADEDSPYWGESCDPDMSHFAMQTELIADCRCGENRMPILSGGLPICQRPSSVPAGTSFGEGPSMRELERNTPRLLHGLFDADARKLYAAFGWTDPSNSYRGLIFEVDADSGDRRIVAGDWPTRFGTETYGAGDFLDEVQNLAFGPDGELYAWTRSVYNAAQIVRVDRESGDRTLIWREHEVLAPERNNANHAQCPDGTDDGRTWVQIWERGFLVEPDGSFLLSVVPNNTAADATPLGIVRISPDGRACEWVTRTGQGANNDLPTLGGGASPQAGQRLQNMFWVDGKVWTFDMNGNVWEVDPADGDRAGVVGGLAADYLSWDDQRGVYWMSGTGGGANNIQVWWPDDGTSFDLSAADAQYLVKDLVWGPLSGPGDTCCQNHLPTHYDPADGLVFVWHDIFGLLKLEPETGNTVIFSL